MEFNTCKTIVIITTDNSDYLIVTAPKIRDEGHGPQAQAVEPVDSLNCFRPVNQFTLEEEKKEKERKREREGIN